MTHRRFVAVLNTIPILAVAGWIAWIIVAYLR